MKIPEKKGLAILRWTMIVVLVLAGLITITGTGEEEEKSTPDSREKGEFTFTVTEYVGDGGKVAHRNTVKKDTGQILKKENDEYYDASENLTAESEDSDGDGTPDWSYTYTYNSENLKAVAVYDKIKEGKVEAAQFFYDTEGNLIKREADLSYDGTTFNEEQRYLYTYEEIAGQWKMTSEKLDENADGTIDYTNVFTYNADGNLATLKYYYGDKGELYSTSSYTYVKVDGVWHIKTGGTDLDNDGTVDYFFVYDYDELGNQTSIEGWIGKDIEEGIKTSVTYSTYDANNKLTKDEIDEDGDGKFESVVYYDYYGDGKLKTKKTDYDNNGKGEEFDLIYNYTYKTIPE